MVLACASSLAPCAGWAATPPTAPSGVAVTGASCTQLTLHWTASVDASGAGLRGYNVYRSGYFLKFVTAPATSTVDTGLSGGRTYTYELSALDNAGNLSARSTLLVATTPTCPDSTPPSMPTGVTATASSCSQATISWQASTDTGGAGLRGYNLYRNGAFVKQLAPSVLSTTDTGLQAAVRYEYTVAAIDNAGNRSALSATAGALTPVCGVVDAVPPSAPAGLSVTAASCTQLNVVWGVASDSGGSGLKGYNVYRSGAMYRQFPAPTTSFADTGLVGNTAYTYVITALDNAGNQSAGTAAVTARTPACPDTIVPSVPAGLSVSVASCGQVNLSWAASTDGGGSGLKAYNVFRNGSLVRQVTTTSMADTGLAASTVYGYAVSAVDNASNQSARSATVSAKTPACPDTVAPTVPAGLSVSAPTCGQVNLAWSAAGDTGGSGLRGYNIYRNGALLKQVLTPATSSSDTTVAAATAYSYALSAVDNAGNQSARSTAVSTATPKCPPSQPPPSGLAGFVPSVGAAKDVVVSGGRAYVASAEFGLAIVDLSTPSKPVGLAGAVEPFYAERVAVAGNLAVLTGNGLGLKVVDIANPRAPRVVGSVAGTMKGVALVGQYAYVIEIVPGNPARTDLVVVNLVNPAAPVVVSRLTVAAATEIAVAGSVAFLPARADGMQVVDIANPAAPRLLATVDTPGTAKDVAVSGGYAFIADGTSVVAIDVRTPSKPAVVGSVATPAVSLAVSGSRLYVVDGLHLTIVDVANPAKPTLLSTTDGYGAQGIAAIGTTAYLASPDVDAATNRGGLYVVDASVPTAPVVLGNLYGGFDDWGVGVVGSVGVVAGNSLGLRVVDVSSAAAPRVVSSVPGTMKGVAMAGSYAYAISVIPGNPARIELAVIDLRTPATPSIVGRLALPSATDVCVVGSIVYVAAGNAGLQIIDVSSPKAPRLVGAVDTAGGAQAVAVFNGYAYVADTTAVVVVDVGTPSKPSIRGSVATPATAIGAGPFGVYAIGGLQLKILDVSKPASPVVVSATASYGAQAVQPAGSLLVLATPGLNHFDASGGLFVLDVSNPALPRLLRQIVVPGITRALTSANGYVYAGDSAAVLDVVVP